MVVCCVLGCAAKGTKMFHSFPKNPDVRKIWIQNTKTFHLTEKQMNSYSKVCKYHFKETDFEVNPRNQQGLKKNAVPTMNLPENVSFQDEMNYAHVSSCKFKESLSSTSLHHVYRRLVINLFRKEDIDNNSREIKLMLVPNFRVDCGILFNFYFALGASGAVQRYPIS
jgi:hypothetical protein